MRPCFVGRGIANLDRTVLEDDLVRQFLRRLQLRGTDLFGREVDGAGFLSHVKRHRRITEQLLKGRREDMLPRVLLHVIATSGGIDFAANRDAGLQPTRRALDKMQDVARLFLLVNIEDPYTSAVSNCIDLSGVEVLAAAGGIESRSIQ